MTNPIVVLALDFDGPVNSWSKGDFLQGDTREQKETTARNNGTFIKNDSSLYSIYISKDDASYLTPLLTSLAIHGVKVVCGSQRMEATDDMKEQMFQAFDTAFGQNRPFLTRDVQHEQQLTGLATPATEKPKSDESKVAYLEATKQYYGVVKSPQVILADDDKKAYATSTKAAGFGFVHIPNPESDMQGKPTPESIAARKAAYVKMWLVTLTKAVSKDVLEQEVYAKWEQYSAEFGFLLQNDQEIKDDPSLYGLLNNLLVIGDIKSLCVQTLRDHPEATLPPLPEECFLDPTQIIKAVQDALTVPNPTDKKTKLQTPISAKQRIEKVKEILDNPTNRKILASEKWSQIWLIDMVCFIWNGFKTPSKVLAAERSKITKMFPQTVQRPAIPTAGN